jgi:hypothetical protein
MNFAAAAAELRQQETARLRDAIVPRLEAMRRMTPETFRELVADMLQRFGHEIKTDPATAPDLITTKGEKKFITRCATPTEPKQTATRELKALHDAVIAPNVNAERGFFITVRSFTDAAEQYAESAPLDLIDGKRPVKALNQSRKHVLMPQTYNAMCCQCGEFVQHRLDREQDEARPCPQRSHGRADDCPRHAGAATARSERRQQHERASARPVQPPLCQPAQCKVRGAHDEAAAREVIYAAGRKTGLPPLS